MSFTMGGFGSGMGPRGALEAFGVEDREGAFYDPKIFARMFTLLKPYARRMTIAGFLTLFETGITLLTPLLIKITIDEYITAGNQEGIYRPLLATTAAFIGLFVASAGQRYLLTWVGQRVLANLREKVFRHLQELSKGYYDTHIVGVTVSRVINDVAEVNELISQGLITLIGDIIILVGIVAILFSLDVRLALITFLVIPLMVVVILWFSRQAKQAYRETRSKVAAVVGNMAEDIAAIRVIQAFVQESYAQKRFEALNRENKTANIRAISLSYLFLPSMEFLSMCSTALVLLAGGWAVIDGHITLGVLVAYLAYTGRFFQPVQEISRLFTTWQSAMAAGEQVFKLLDTAPEVMDSIDARDVNISAGKVTLENVSFRYRPDTPLVLKNISLEINPGQTIALVGPTGAGKTSIANLVARFYDVDEGAVRIDGIDIRDISLHSLYRQIGMVTQDPFLFSRSIAENIRFSRQDANDKDVQKAAEIANAHNFISALPEGYQTQILEGGVNLSAGQKQLVAIARALLANPKIILLDEATANIDTMSEYAIQAAIARILEGRTALVIAHRLSTVQNVDVIYVIDDGRIVEQGSHAELIKQSGLYSSLYHRQFIDNGAG